VSEGGSGGVLAAVVSEKTCLSLLNLLQRAADVGWMAMEKIGDLRSERTLLQHGFADELIAGIYYGFKTLLPVKFRW